MYTILSNDFNLNHYENKHESSMCVYIYGKYGNVTTITTLCTINIIINIIINTTAFLCINSYPRIEFLFIWLR
jgi:hypothetical protein